MTEIYREVKPDKIPGKSGEVVDVVAGRNLSNLTSMEIKRVGIKNYYWCIIIKNLHPK